MYYGPRGVIQYHDQWSASSLCTRGIPSPVPQEEGEREREREREREKGELSGLSENAWDCVPPSQRVRGASTHRKQCSLVTQDMQVQLTCVYSG